jgi:hypothetical protein
LNGGKSLPEQAIVFGHTAPGQYGPPHVHWVKPVPTQRAYAIFPVQPLQVLESMGS